MRNVARNTGPVEDDDETPETDQWGDGPVGLVDEDDDIENPFDDESEEWDEDEFEDDDGYDEEDYDEDQDVDEELDFIPDPGYNRKCSTRVYPDHNWNEW